MALYQGRALKTEAVRPRRPTGRVGRVLRMLAAIGVVVGLAHLPWESLRGRLFTLTHIRVDGVRYLDAARVARVAGLAPGQDVTALDCARARQALLLDARIERARVSRMWPRGVRVSVAERTPVMLVRHGPVWEMDSSGVLLEPLADGVVADVPLLAGVSFEGIPAGTRVELREVQRGLAWVQALAESDIQLGGRVSEVDVGDSRSTALLLMDGTRVLTPAWPPGTRTLSALRVVLADLQRRGTAAREVDLRFQNQVIVRPSGPVAAEEGHVALQSPIGPVDPAGPRAAEHRN